MLVRHFAIMLLVSGALVAAAMADGEEGSELAQMQTLVAQAKVSMADALAVASRELKDAKPLSVELQTRDGKAVYEITMIAGTQRVEIEVDAASGKIASVVKDDMESATGHRWKFDKEEVGTLPPDWVIREANPTKALAQWTIEADESAPSKPNVLSIKSSNGNATYNLALIEKTAYQDVNLSVKIRGNTGEDDQGGGLVWRCKDEKNYYLCRINPLESNYRVYKVVDGKRVQLQSVDFETPTGKWFRLRVRMRGDTISCYCDGKKWLEVKDDTFKDAGMIGLWTKADASSSFDDLRAWPITGGSEWQDSKP